MNQTLTHIYICIYTPAPIDFNFQIFSSLSSVFRNWMGLAPFKFKSGTWGEILFRIESFFPIYKIRNQIYKKICMSMKSDIAES